MQKGQQNHKKWDQQLIWNFGCSTYPKSHPGVKIDPKMAGGGQNWPRCTPAGPTNLFGAKKTSFFHTEWPNCVCGLNENGWKRLIGQRLQNIPANGKLRLPESFLFCMMERVPGGMFWSKVAPRGTIWPPRKSAFFYERGQKRMKEWHKVTFMNELVKALNDTRILAPADLR